MKNLLAIAALCLALSSWATAEEHHVHKHQHNHKHDASEPTRDSGEPIDTPNDQGCEQRIALHVKGLVCDFCARSIEKVFKKKKVADVDVDLANGLIQVYLTPSQALEDASLHKLVKNSGYLLERIERGCSDD